MDVNMPAMAMLAIASLGRLGMALLKPVQAAKHGHNRANVSKEPDNIAVHFGDVEGLELQSPAFIYPESVPAAFADGTQGPTPDDVLDDFLRSLADRNKWLKYDGHSLTSDEGRRVPYVRLSSGPRAVSSTNKVRVWLQGGVHGNEPAGDQAIMALLGAMDANQTWAAELLDKVDVLALPRYSHDGVFHFQRKLANGDDPNRDHIKLAHNHTRNVKALFNNFNPHVAADLHEYTAVKSLGRYSHAADGFFSAAKNLNIHPGIRALSEDLFAPAMAAAMEARDLRWEPYVKGSANSTPDSPLSLSEASSDAYTGRNAMGLSQCVAFLVETRGIRIADQHFQRRTAAGLTMVSAILQTAADNAHMVRATIANSVDRFVRSTDDVFVTDLPSPKNRTFTMVDRTNGSLVYVPVRFRSTTPVVANLTRHRPEAYLIPSKWVDLAERLMAAGLQVQKWSVPWNGTVEVFQVKSAVSSTRPFEGIFPTNLKTELVRRELSFPAGSFLVSTRQKNAALAFVALEPESTSSYVSMNLVPAAAGDELPIFRVPA